MVEHLRRHMAPGVTILVRSTQGARIFLYPVEIWHDGFGVHHPEDEVINHQLRHHPAQAASGGGPPRPSLPTIHRMPVATAMSPPLAICLGARATRGHAASTAAEKGVGEETWLLIGGSHVGPALTRHR